MGVRYDIEKQHFVFDFKHDGQEDIISLTGKGYEVTASVNVSIMDMNLLAAWTAAYAAPS